MTTRLSMELRSAPTTYRPVSLIARGGMAEVWRAEATVEGGARYQVAIKRVLPNMGEPLFRAMFEDEARLGMLLRHPNIVRVYDARDVGGTYIMVMELVDGDTLKGLLDPAHARGAFMPLEASLYIARELARSLAYCHTAVDAKGADLNIIHRDVSPHNLLLGKDGVVKLTDFGLAEASFQDSREMVGGKMGYLAPELVQGGPIGPPLDVFALGIVLWEMLGGRRLFRGKDDGETVRQVARCEVPRLSDLNPAVPPAVDGLLARILTPDPTRRLTAAVVADALDGALAGTGVGPRDISLMIGMHLAKQDKNGGDFAAAMGLAMLEQELADFAALAGGDAPLDPKAFAQSASGLRVRPDVSGEMSADDFELDFGD